jgi:pyruvate kinase
MRLTMIRTKIVCTLGPASDTDDIVRALIRAGMSVARINFSHGDHATHAARIERVRRIAQEENVVLAVLGDLQGPKLRVGKLEGDAVEVQAGQEITLTLREVLGNAHEVTLPHPELVNVVHPGQRLLLDDGQLEFVVKEANPPDIRCTVVTGGSLGSHKGVSAPGAKMELSALTDKDRIDARFAVEQQVDYLALSFVRTGDDVCELRTLLNNLGSDIPIITKIEKSEAIDNFEDILQCSDGIMIARGDLGVETPAESVPLVQKHLIRRCNLRGLPVITATQMLNSMITNPRPTRAEASDVANAILDGTDAVMLSGETAAGDYPIQSVQTMARIASMTEPEFPYDTWMADVAVDEHAIDAAIGRATVDIAESLGAQAIATLTHSGRTARLIAQYRPSIPVFAAATTEKVQRQLALVWGVVPMLTGHHPTTDDRIRAAAALSVKSGLAHQGDLIVIAAGIGTPQNRRTNLLTVHTVEE